MLTQIRGRRPESIEFDVYCGKKIITFQEEREWRGHCWLGLPEINSREQESPKGWLTFGEEEMHFGVA